MNAAKLMNTLYDQDYSLEDAAGALELRVDQLLPRVFGEEDFVLEDIRRFKALLGLTDEEVDEIFFS